MIVLASASVTNGSNKQIWEEVEKGYQRTGKAGIRHFFLLFSEVC
jgi:hypothetical protein